VKWPFNPVGESNNIPWIPKKSLALRLAAAGLFTSELSASGVSALDTDLDRVQV